MVDNFGCHPHNPSYGTICHRSYAIDLSIDDSSYYLVDIGELCSKLAERWLHACRPGAKVHRHEDKSYGLNSNSIMVACNVITLSK